MSATLSALQERLGAAIDGTRFISISIDPENDTPPRLAEYAQRSKARSQWSFLTGREDNVIAVRKAFGVYTGSKMLHQPITFLRGSPRDPWVRLGGLMSAAELAAEYQRALDK
jgi:protein SCO1/2